MQIDLANLLSIHPANFLSDAPEFTSARVLLTMGHHRIARERLRWQHQVVNQLCAAFDQIVVEDLNIKETCSNPTCAAVKDKLPVWVRAYECEDCGMVLDCDVNASQNLETHSVSWKPLKSTIKSSTSGSGKGICRKVAVAA